MCGMQCSFNNVNSSKVIVYVYIYEENTAKCTITAKSIAFGSCTPRLLHHGSTILNE